MNASVVIPAHNEEGLLEKSLDSVQGQGTEIIVVGGGEDRTLEVAEEHPAVDTVIEDSSAGPAPARNRGAEQASGEVLLFMDADTAVPEGWVDAHLSNYREGVVGVGAPLKPLEGGLKHRVMFKILSDWWYRAAWKVGFVQQSGSNCSYLKEVFMEEGGFDEDMGFVEDTELSLRMKRRGRIVYDPEAWAWTSARREEGMGYFRLFLRYTHAYLLHFILGRELEHDYFRGD